MKKLSILFLSLALVFCFSSCALNATKSAADTVVIEENEYTKAFTGELYPVDDSFMSTDGVIVSGSQYYKYSNAQYDCYITYDHNAEPNVYFENINLDDAVSYYNDPCNWSFFCLLGNVFDENEQQILEVKEMDPVMFDQLLEFAAENDNNPFTSFNNEDGLKEVPIPNPDDWTADEIHFYKASIDGAFITSKGYTFVLVENQLCLLYQYDFADEETPVMLVKGVPSEISDYFCCLLNELQCG